jgi:hypothetical protein
MDFKYKNQELIRDHSDNEGLRESYINIMQGHPQFELTGRMSRVMRPADA